MKIIRFKVGYNLESRQNWAYGYTALYTCRYLQDFKINKFMFMFNMPHK